MTKAERAAIEAAVAGHLPSDEERKALRGMLDKIDRRPPPGMTVKEYIDVLESVLGARVALPPKPSPSWYANMARRLREFGVDSDSARLAATTAARLWKGPLSAESILNRISTLTAAPPGGTASGGSVARAEFNPEDVE